MSAFARNNMSYKYQRARTSRVGLVHEDENALRFPRIWDDAGNSIVEHVAGADDFQVAEAIYHAVIARWPAARITLRQGIRVVHDTGQRLAIDVPSQVSLKEKPRPARDRG